MGTSKLNDALQDRVSVVVATRDRPDALERCLRAVVTNTLLPAEIIVVDGGSSGISEQLRGSLDATTTLVHLLAPASGVSHARNLGIAQASFDLIAFTDDDCVPARTWLAALLAACRSDDVDGVTGRVLPLLSGDGSRVAVSSRTGETPARYAGRKASLAPWEAGTGGNLLLRRPVLITVGGFDERFGPGAPYRAAEDVELLYRVLRGGFTIAYEPKSIVFHEMRTRRQRLATRYPYGYGMGALIGGRARAESDFVPLIVAYFSLQFSRLIVSLRSGSGFGVLEPILTIVGFVAGAASWWRREREKSRRAAS